MCYDKKNNKSNVNKSIASQIYMKNNFNSNSVNPNNFNHIAKSNNDLNKTPVSGNSHNSVNFNNNNIIINNKYESDSSKPITNLNMIFKFKTILNDELNSKKNKIIKVDAKEVIRNKSINKNKTSSNQMNNDKNLNNTGNPNPKDYHFNHKSNNSIWNFLNKEESNIESQKTINVNNTLKKKNDPEISNQNKKILNMNSTLKSGNSISKSKVKSSKINEYNKFDALKYSLNQLKDFFNTQKQTNPKSRSKGKVSNMGNI